MCFNIPKPYVGWIMTDIPPCPVCSSAAHEVRGRLYLGWQGVCVSLSGPVTVEVELT